MKTFRKICFYAFALLAMLLCLILGFIEMRTLVSGDWALLQSPLAGASSYLFRGLYFLLTLLILISFFVGQTQHKPITYPFILIYLFATVGAGLSFLFYDWYFSAALVGLLILTFLFARFRPEGE